jgi:acetyltransferase EpsM
MNTIYIIGAGGHAKQVIDILLDNSYQICGIFDSYRSGYFYRNLPILGTIDDVLSIVPKNSNLFITFGDNKYRMDLYLKFKEYNFPNCISKQSYISQSTKIGYGNYIGCFTKIGEDCVVGNFNILNEGSIVAHDNFINDFNHLSINTSTGGNVIIGNLNLIGIGANILPKMTILDNNTIGAGCLVNKNIHFESKCIGVPMKII